ncbi:alpha/beta fold hydrolase [Propionivibrio sp.]|uniref:alpha/beta fold hydrolase n=1 Tax=Propionivibrio sp. TaxID=2212460 RepID=UPI003BF27534
MTDKTAPAQRQSNVRCTSPSGLHRMAYYEWGERDNPKVLICVHGLSRNGRDFDDLARVLASDYRVICPDVVGRGRSDWLRDPLAYGIRQDVADMMVLIARLDVESVHWLGTSMGGLIGMVLASLEGTPIKRLLLNDVGPVVSPESIKRIGDYIGRAPKFANLADAERYIRLVSAPFGPLTDAQWRHLTESSLRQTADGRLEMSYDPGIAESFRRTMAAGEIDLWPIYERISCPTLVVRGAESDLLTVETIQAMAVRGPCPRIVEVPGVGHAPMFMDDVQIGIVRDFFLAD